MLNRFVANWLREQAQDALLRGLDPANPDKNPQSDAATSGSSDTPSVDVALFFPAANQAAGLVDLLRGVQVSECHGFVERVGQLQDRRVAVVETSQTNEPLALVVRDIIRLRQPQWVLASGFAASLQRHVARGHLLVANRLIDAQGYSLVIDAKMATTKALHVGTLLSAGSPASENVDTPAAAETVAANTAASSALAWETQAAVIGEVCRLLKTKMMAIHGVSRLASDPREGNVAHELQSQDSLAGMLGVAAGALIEKPSSLKALWNEKEATLVISDRLAKFLKGVVLQLPT